MKIRIGGRVEAEAVAEFHLRVTEGGTSQVVAVSTTSAQSTAINDVAHVLIYTNTAVAVRQGSNPTALTDGTDQVIPAGLYRVAITPGNKLAFKTLTGTGNVYITPGA